MASNNTPLLPAAESNVEDSTNYSNLDANPTANDGFTKVAIGVLVGATLGGIAGALTNRGVVDRINQTIRGVGNAVKRAAANVNNDVQNVGDAVYSVTTGVNDTVKDVGDAVKETAEGVNSTVRHTVSSVKHTAENVNGTVKSTLSSIKENAQENEPSGQQDTNNTPEQETLYKLIPVNPNESNL